MVRSWMNHQQLVSVKNELEVSCKKCCWYPHFESHIEVFYLVPTPNLLGLYNLKVSMNKKYFKQLRRCESVDKLWVLGQLYYVYEIGK